MHCFRNEIIKAQHKNIYKLTVCRCVYFLHLVGTVQIYNVGMETV